jgi:hypothetical protein
MSIYATLWQLQFPRYGDDHTACEWVEVVAQGVPGHIGTPSPGHGYERGDPYADFLPPPIAVAPDEQGESLRAVVIVRDGTQKDGQRYVDPLLVLTGEEYQNSTFDELHRRICDALRGSRPEVVMEAWGPDGSVRLAMKDGSSRLLSAEELRTRGPGRMTRVQAKEAERERFLALARRFKESSDPGESERLREELARLTFGD